MVVKENNALLITYFSINNTNVGLIEAKREGLPITEGLQQAQDYGSKLGVRYVYSTNGTRDF